MRELICIECPRGCNLIVDEQNDYKVTGNKCNRGAIYGKNEVTNPQRMISSTVKINGAIYSRLPVVTSDYVPKEFLFKIMFELNEVSVNSPVKMGDVIIKNVCGLNVDIIATKNM